jgi:ABC-type polysaccharide/polyol phosphate export permease
MSTQAFSAPTAASAGAELPKLAAFLRRDALVAWSYRASLLSEWAMLGLQAVMFYFVGRMVNVETLPAYGGVRASYLEFAAVGIALGAFLQLSLGRVATGIRSEQMMGTLESLMMTPTAPSTIQAGTVVYDLVYIPVRTAIFLGVVAVAFGLHFEPSGFLPAALVLLAFVPFAWGLGVASAAAVTTFKRGEGVAGILVAALTLVSGAYIPLAVFPHWVMRAATANPITLAVNGMRAPLITGSWTGVAHALVILVPTSAATLAVGIVLFRLALRREHRRGSLGMY